ncbi:type I polyketide synthase [Paractinoplanes brasiliensis]|uniref:Enediyne polyketide synthase n=1 Tax=Paractinoplanes brasiliensis TaxID=52695 RepID=A0A4R6JYW3_9ACTN|nr:type I polyketide synthase [Actinoplanes brasiliensis]TDO42073.1 enediyne polyketide synthase [Actinoplanes brasiliensis]GID33052.1 polyketide synthase [Actinoplanes brasiliensis]
MTRIAIVGIACRYPDATSPKELWENAVAGRRAFRRLPDVRMRLEDYWDADRSAPDKFYARNAAVIEGYEFDRIAYKVAGSTYRGTDLTHWLALDVAAMALADAGFPMAERLPRERTGVIVGNTLTGEFSRANQLRLRWPFVRRMVAAALKEQDWNDDQLADFLDTFEATFKSPFPAVDEDTLAGGLSNTIAGRICNHFDLKGGGYTVDGACSSSLLSVATACKGLLDGELDVAIAGGVDLSIDPFEIIGFAKTGALATGEMRLYDRNSNGFWPGEGCGMVVLMREDDAVAAGHRIYASIAGWGISSDGKGGMTRPELAGYRLALRRAYERAGFGIETVPLFEGHGTGTQVGDATELTALATARGEAARPGARPAAVGSIKAMIGHTKAAAGVAGLIKAAMAVHHEVLPPTIGCVDPHEVLAAEDAPLRPLRKAEAWPADEAVRAGVTAMGFGGINTHIVLENTRPRRRARLDTRTGDLASSLQDAELLLVDALSAGELRERLTRLTDFVAGVAYAELSDLAGTLHRELRDLPWRAAVVASSPEQAERRLRRLGEALDAGQTAVFDPDGGSFLGSATGPGRVAFLFPGQGSGRGTSGGALRRRFAEAEEVYQRAGLPSSGDMVATQTAQPRIVTGSLAGLQVLAGIGIDAHAAVGHSLGEIAALHWAGAVDEDALLRIAGIRGRTMAEHSTSGTMAGLGGSAEQVEALGLDPAVVIAGYNGPHQTVVAGDLESVRQACDQAKEAGMTATMLAVSHAFHSPLVAPAADAFAERLGAEAFGEVRRRVHSTVTGEVLDPDTDVQELLRRQITAPVRFAQAVEQAAKDVDLFIEVGPGRVLSGLAGQIAAVPAVSLNTDDESIGSLLGVVAAAFVAASTSVDAALFHGRLLRPLQVGAEFSFFANPCEQAPSLTLAAKPATRPETPAERAGDGEGALDLLRRLAADRAELPPDLVAAESRMLDDLHLSSITVGQIVNQVAQAMNIPPAQAPTNFATATVRELAEALQAQAGTGLSSDTAAAPVVTGAADWARAWRIDLDELPRPAPAPAAGNGPWRLYADAGDSLAARLAAALETARAGAGVLVAVPPSGDLSGALDGVKEAVTGDGRRSLVLLQRGAVGAGLAKTAHLEAPALRTTVLRVPDGWDDVETLVAEVAATTGFSEVHYDPAGARRVPTLRPMSVDPAAPAPPLGPSDVLLVTGGGKGITAECALAMAQDSGAALAVLGRSDPDGDPELAANLRRIAAAGVTVRYARADVTRPEQVRAAVGALAAELGEVTAVLHGAGRNEPKALTSVTTDDLRATAEPKVDGLRHVLDVVGPGLRLLVTLGSIIGRAGLRGEAHYSVANERLAELTARVGADNPDCRAICLEWSVWSGVGMGERLAVVEALSRDGITPVTPDQGIRILRRLLADTRTPGVVVISGRTEGIHTVRYDEPELPLLRFTERPLVRYHGVELVTEVELSAGTDLYLADHHLDGNMLFPAVFGMEAMAQVSAAVTGRAEPPVIENAEFLRPIVVPPGGSTTIRVAATVVADDAVEVAIHSAETGFAVEHFRARCRYPVQPAPDAPFGTVADGQPEVAVDPAADLYGDVLFQGARFQRVRRYHRAAARDVDAELAAAPGTAWFSAYLPQTLLLGDPGIRDALMHGTQVCVPDATLLPAGVTRIHPAGARLGGEGRFRYRAVERRQDGDAYVYDVVLCTPDGTVIERWDGLRLHAVRKKDGRGPWVVPLLGAYLTRAAAEVAGMRVEVAVEQSGEPAADYLAWRRARTSRVIARALGRPSVITYRPDGRPETPGASISAGHGAGVTIGVAGDGPVGCDVEVVERREPDTWAGLLGRHAGLADIVVTMLGEEAGTASTRVWTAIESLRKAGQSDRTPLVLLPDARPGWVTFSSGELRVATFATTVRGVEKPVVFALLADAQPGTR